MGDILGTVRCVHKDTQFAAGDEKERIPHLPLAHDYVAILKAQDRERARDRHERFLRQLGKEGKRMVLLLVANEYGQIQGRAQGVLGRMLKGFGMASIASLEFGFGIDRRGTNRKTCQLRRSRGISLDEQLLNVFDGLSEPNQGLASHQRRQGMACADVVDGDCAIDLGRIVCGSG